MQEKNLDSHKMNQNFSDLLHQAIQLELNVGQLYMLFHRLLPDDAEFWWELSLEEDNHAALLKTANQMMKSHVEIPEDILPHGINELSDSNQMILRTMEDFEKAPDRTRAFQLALEIEESAGESHYDKFMQSAPDSRIAKIFKKLNGDDINHAERIRQYMLDHQIPEAK